MTIITYLIRLNQYYYSIICSLVSFIVKFIPLKHLSFDDLNSPKYQKFKVDRMPIIFESAKQDYTFLIEYYLQRYNRIIRPIKRRNGRNIPESVICPFCGAPHEYIYDNNGGKGQYQCKVCHHTFHDGNKDISKLHLLCPYCSHALSPVKNRKNFIVHKCVNNNCSYYKQNLAALPKDLPQEEHWKYKLRYIYREFTIDFFKMDLSRLPQWAASFKFRKNNSHIMGLCLTYHVNLGLSLRKTAQAMKDIHNVNISHTMVSNYCKTAAVLVKPFVDNFDYQPSADLAADETYIKIKGVKGYLWLIMDTISRSILGYQVSKSRDVGPCILTMRMALGKFKEFPGKALKFIADGYSAYPLAAQQCMLHNNWDFDVTRVIGLSNDDAVSKEFRPYKQLIERLNRTFKASYRVTCGYDNDDGAHYGAALWVAYYNFLRPHSIYRPQRPLNRVKELETASNMPGKWQMLIFLGQQEILCQQKQ